MSQDPNKKYLFDNPTNVKLVVRLLVASCVVLVGLDLVLHRHVDHPWESLPGFYALYGFVACVLLVLLAKELRKLVMRSEDYYQQPDEPQNAEDSPEGTASSRQPGADDD